MNAGKKLIADAFQSVCSDSFTLHTDCLPVGNQSLLQHDWSVVETETQRLPAYSHAECVLRDYFIHTLIPIYLWLDNNNQ